MALVNVVREQEKKRCFGAGERLGQLWCSEPFQERSRVRRSKRREKTEKSDEMSADELSRR